MLSFVVFFIFTIPEPPESLFQSPSVAYMKGQEGILMSLLAKKRMVLGWCYYLFVLSPFSKKIYQFRSELDSSPLTCIDLNKTSVQPESPTDKNGRFILHFFKSNKERAMCLAADSSDTQLTWLRALEKAGVEILPGVNEAAEKIKNSSSIFEFEAKTIDGELVSLEKYRGHVTLIVNVASL